MPFLEECHQLPSPSVETTILSSKNQDALGSDSGDIFLQNMENKYPLIDKHRLSQDSCAIFFKDALSRNQEDEILSVSDVSEIDKNHYISRDAQIRQIMKDLTENVSVDPSERLCYNEGEISRGDEPSHIASECGGSQNKYVLTNNTRDEMVDKFISSSKEAEMNNHVAMESQRKLFEMQEKKLNALIESQSEREKELSNKDARHRELREKEVSLELEKNELRLHTASEREKLLKELLDTERSLREELERGTTDAVEELKSELQTLKTIITNRPSQLQQTSGIHGTDTCHTSIIRPNSIKMDDPYSIISTNSQDMSGTSRITTSMTLLLDQPTPAAPLPRPMSSRVLPRSYDYSSRTVATPSYKSTISSGVRNNLPANGGNCINRSKEVFHQYMTSRDITNRDNLKRIHRRSRSLEDGTAQSSTYFIGNPSDNNDVGPSPLGHVEVEMGDDKMEFPSSFGRPYGSLGGPWGNDGNAVSKGDSHIPTRKQPNGTDCKNEKPQTAYNQPISHPINTGEVRKQRVTGRRFYIQQLDGPTLRDTSPLPDVAVPDVASYTDDDRKVLSAVDVKKVVSSYSQMQSNTPPSYLTKMDDRHQTLHGSRGRHYTETPEKRTNNETVEGVTSQTGDFINDGANCNKEFYHTLGSPSPRVPSGKKFRNPFQNIINQTSLSAQEDERLVLENMGDPDYQSSLIESNSTFQKVKELKDKGDDVDAFLSEARDRRRKLLDSFKEKLSYRRRRSMSADCLPDEMLA